MRLPFRSTSCTGFAPVFRLCVIASVSPLCLGFVSLHGTGDGRLTVGGSTPGLPASTPGWRYTTALFNSATSIWRRDGVVAHARFDSVQDVGLLRIELDTRVLTQRDQVLHLPQPDTLRMRYEERRGDRLVFAEEAVSGELRVTWREDRRPLLRFEVSATFRGGQAGGPYRDGRATLTFLEPDRAQPLSVVLPVLGLSITGLGIAGTLPPPPAGEPPPGSQPPPGLGLGDVVDGVGDIVDVAADSGCGNNAADDTPSCAEGQSDGCSGDSAPECGGSGGSAFDGCGSGGASAFEGCGSGAASACGGASPNCAVSGALGQRGRAMRTLGKRRPVVVRYLPYAALFFFIAGLKWRLRRRTPNREALGDPAAPDQPSAA